MALAAPTSVAATSSTRTTLPLRAVPALRSIALRAGAAPTEPSVMPCVVIPALTGLSAPAKRGRMNGGASCAAPAQEDLRRASQGPAHGMTQPHDVTDDLGDRAVMLGRDFLVDLDGAVQGAGERRVLDHGNVVAARHV